MPVVDPFTVPESLVGSNLYSSYWLATLAGLQYAESADVCRAFLLAGGAEEAVRIPLPGVALLPAADIGFWPGDRALVFCRGTADWLQLATQLFGAALVTRAPWPGRVGNTHSALAVLLQVLVEDWLAPFLVETVALGGHSMGGTVAQLLVVPTVVAGRSVSAVWTFGGPRGGDQTYAAAMVPSACLRWTTAGDPVPGLPPGRDPLLDALLWLSPVSQVTGFVHWGRRGHLLASGQILQPAGDPAQLGAGALSSAELLAGGLAEFEAHSPAEYAARLRLALGPLATSSPDVAALDAVWEDLTGPGTIESWFDPRSCGRD